MIRDIYIGALSAAKSLGVQYADAQDAAQDTVIRALGRAIQHPRAYGRRAVRSALIDAQRKRRPTVDLRVERLAECRVDRSAELAELRAALARSGADRFHKARAGERANIRARLVKEGWGR